RASNVSSDQISIAWNASSDNVAVTGYRLYKNGSATHFASTASLSFNDTGLVSGQTYQYRVTAVDEAGNESVMSSVLTITTLVVVDPQPANLSWTSPTRNSDDSCLSGIEGYRVSFGSASGIYTQTVDLSLSGGEVLCTQSDFDAVCNEPIMSCSYSTTPLSAGTWYFVVQAQDQSGVYSMYSNEASKIIE
ncbi:MAG: fibronectin type III domain-containing protein, partial [Gammaproteobacteria bacterium]|nr:fibronectin type III domain-containing protein [Gammaproteobacteria bacterium]